MSTGTSLWALATLGVIMTTNLLFNLIKKDIFSNCSLSTCFNDTRDINNFILNVTVLLEKAYSFVSIIDSKLVGLAVFLIANIFTGLINLTIATVRVSTSLALLILFINALVSTFIPFLVYYLFYRRANKIYQNNYVSSLKC